MDEELKVVVTSVLEADEAASAQRIAGQLPAISQRINSGSKIKVQVELDESTAASSAKSYAQKVSQAAKAQRIGMSVELDQSAISRMKAQLKDLGVNSNISQAMVKQLDQMGVRIDQLSGKWESIEGEEEKLLRVLVQGTDELGRNVTVMQSYNAETQELDSRVTSVTLNIEKMRQADEKAAKAAHTANESRVAALQTQLDMLEKLRSNYSGNGKGDAVANADHLTELSEKYNSIKQQIQSLLNTSGVYEKSRRAQIDSEIRELERLITEYQKAEKTATDLRSKDVASVKIEQGFKLDEFEAKLKTAGTLTDELKAKVTNLRAELDAVGDSQGMTKFLDNFGAVKAEAGAAAAAEQLRQKIASVNAEMAAMPSNISAMEGRMRQLSAPTDNLKANVAEVHRLMAEWNNDPSDEKKIQIYEQINEKLKLCNSEITRLNQAETSGVRDFKLTQGLDTAKADLATIRRQWSAFTNDRGLEQKFQTLSKGLSNIRNQADLTKWNAQFSTLKSEIKAAGLNMQSLGDIIRNNLAKVGQWLGATTIIFRAFSTIKTAVSTVIDMDTAMIDLRKTTNATEAEYRAFYQSANETARALGATTEEVISQTAEWSRLGYTMQEAAELAKNSAIFSAVSPGMGQELATDGLVSIIKAFDVDVDDSMDGIISKVNAVGNAFSVSNTDIVNALTRSSSAMAAANNTFDETVALATAAIEITRDAEGVGNGLKTLSMRIRGYDEETEEYSEDVAMLTGKIADLTKTAKTPGGISLFEPGDPNTYKSTFDILKEISEIWDELTDKNRATLLEALFGKRQAQIGAAILSNFDQAKASIETMANSAGSAEREMEKITQSLEYRINALGQTWVGVAQNLFQTGDIKAVISVLQVFSSAIEGITSKLGLFGTAALGGFVTALVQAHKTVGRPKMRGFINVPTYAPVATRNEFAA